MAPRRPLLSLLLALVLVSVLAPSTLGDSSSSTTTTTTTTVSNTTSESYCEACRDSGHCSQAYKGDPGIYCGAWLSAASQRLACCCPATGQCAKSQSNYECLCSGSSSSSKPSSSASSSSSSAASSERKTYIIIASALFIVGLLAMGLYCFYQRRNNDRYSDHDATYIVEQPTVYVQPPPLGYAPQFAPQYAPQSAGYAVHHGYDDRRGGRVGYSGATVAAGAGAGFLGGMLIGDMIDAGDGNTYNTYNDYGGGGGGDDGGMFAGDF